MNSVIYLLILKYSLLYEVDPTLVSAVIQNESGFNVAAVGAVGEVGLMQIRPEYYRQYTKKELMDPELNITLGIAHLKDALDRCKHKKDNAGIVCYNFGVHGGSKLKHPKKSRYYKRVMTSYRKLQNEISH